jgi:hypothetical protein
MVMLTTQELGGLSMNVPVWLKPAIWGGVAGAVATMFLGFNQGGWMLGSSAETMAQQRSAVAVTEALVPICVDQSRSDPEFAGKLTQLKALTSPYQQREFIMSAGWATVAAAEKPSSSLAEACAKVLLAPEQT